MPKRLRRPADPRYTLTQLEEHDWGPPTYDSHLVTTIHALRYKPIGQFTVEDLRISLGQKMSVEILLPLALEQLELDPLVSGDFFEGDLLRNVVQCEEQWPCDAETLERIRMILRRAIEELATDPDLHDTALGRELLAEFTMALGRHDLKQA
jgi:hypothetical protein